MKKCLKILTILVILGGLSLVMTACAKGPFKTFEEKVSTVTEAFTGIEISADTADITLLPSSDGSCRIVSFDHKRISYITSVTDGVLKIEKKDERGFLSRIFNFGKQTLAVYLPSAEYESLKINSSTGDISVTDQFSFGDTEINISTGDIELKNLMLYDIKTEELLPRGTEIHLTKVAGGSKMHLLTSHTEAYYSVEDKDGDGFVDEPAFDINLDGVVDPPRDTDGNGDDKNTSISYTDIVESGEDYDSGVPSGTYVNFNRVRPPEYIKITDNHGGYVYVMPRTSGEGISDGDYYDRTESYGGFFGDTKFYYSEEEFFLGTAERSNETYFIFR